MLIFALFSLLAAAQQMPLLLPETASLHNRLIHVLPQIEALKNVGGTAGISIGVLSHGHVVLETNLGFSNVERRLVANSSTRYPIASLTKAFVAATIAQLVDEGLLKWDEPLTSYIPELAFEHNPSLAGQLSLIDILSHRTGLARLDALWLGADSQTIIAKNFTVAMCSLLPSVHPVRSKWLYNNWMYALAGEVGKMGLTDGNVMTSAGGMRSTVGDLLTWGNSLLSLFRDDETPLASLNTILSGHSFINSIAVSDEVYALGFAKVITPAQFGKISFNPSLLEAMPVIGAGSKPEQVFYHSGAGAGYNHCFMLVPGSQSVIVVLTNSVSQGDTADWVAQSLLQVILNEKHPLDLKPFAERAAAKWRRTHHEMTEALEKDRKPDSPEPTHEALQGRYWHRTRALYLDIFQEDGRLKFNINGELKQEHVLSHYSNDTFIFLPSADERLRSGLFHYSPPAWLLHFKKDSSGRFTEMQWNIDSESPFPEKFVREES
ncbi:hypothetical protein TrVFT333_005716 [Trichoderma virens FT-333]|nr:hypothetical protein TrVFT333_005716 [Trichoderma virens FT-333]